MGGKRQREETEGRHIGVEKEGNRPRGTDIGQRSLRRDRRTIQREETEGRYIGGENEGKR